MLMLSPVMFGRLCLLRERMSSGNWISWHLENIVHWAFRWRRELIKKTLYSIEFNCIYVEIVRNVLCFLLSVHEWIQPSVFVDTHKYTIQKSVSVRSRWTVSIPHCQQFLYRTITQKRLLMLSTTLTTTQCNHYHHTRTVYRWCCCCCGAFILQINTKCAQISFIHFHYGSYNETVFANARTLSIK